MNIFNFKKSGLAMACALIACSGAYAQTGNQTDDQFRDEPIWRSGDAGIPGDVTPSERPARDASEQGRDASELSESRRDYNDRDWQSDSDQRQAGSAGLRDAAQSDQETIVYFEFDSADLSEEAKESLRSLSKTIGERDSQNLEVVIEGHTDSTGPSVYNEYLSEKRAKSVKSYLEEQDLEVSNWNVVPAGDSSPLGDNDSRSGREENRRVEVRLQPSDAPARADDELSVR